MQNAAASKLLASLSLEELLAILKKMKGKLKAINETELSTTTEKSIRSDLDTETALVVSEINSRLTNYNASIVFDNEVTPVDTFIFAELNPLDNMPVKQILGCEIIGDKVHFQTINNEGHKGMRKTSRSEFIMKQIEQFRISIEAQQY